MSASRSMPEDTRRLVWGRGDGLVFLGLLLLLMTFPLLKGGNRDWASLWFGAGVFSLLGLWFVSFALGRVAFARTAMAAYPLLILWLGWLLYLAGQSQLVALEGFYNLLPKAVGLERQTVSLGDTYTYLLQSLSYFVVFLLVLLTVRDSKRRRFFAGGIVIGGAFQALYGTIFLLSGAEVGLFGDEASPLRAATGTFVNRNHFAGYLQLTAAVGVGLVLADLGGGYSSGWRARFRSFIEFMLSDTVRLRVIIAIMVVALVLTRSRMGNIAFFNALAIAGLIYIVLRERRLFLKAFLLFATFFFIDLLILGNWFGLDELVQRLEATNVQKEMRVDVFPDLLRAAQAYWPFGSGGGTFYTAFPEFRSHEISKLHYHAHNDYMEFAIETGVFGLALLGGIVALVMWHAVRLLRRRKDRLVGGIAFAGIMATIAMLIHATVDFNFQIPANAATYVAILALVMSCSLERRSERGRWR